MELLNHVFLPRHQVLYISDILVLLVGHESQLLCDPVLSPRLRRRWRRVVQIWPSYVDAPSCIIRIPIQHFRTRASACLAEWNHRWMETDDIIGARGVCQTIAPFCCWPEIDRIAHLFVTPLRVASDFLLSATNHKGIWQETCFWPVEGGVWGRRRDRRLF